MAISNPDYAITCLQLRYDTPTRCLARSSVDSPTQSLFQLALAYCTSFCGRSSHNIVNFYTIFIQKLSKLEIFITLLSIQMGPKLTFIIAILFILVLCIKIRI